MCKMKKCIRVRVFSLHNLIVLMFFFVLLSAFSACKDENNKKRTNTGTRQNQTTERNVITTDQTGDQQVGSQTTTDTTGDQGQQFGESQDDGSIDDNLSTTTPNGPCFIDNKITRMDVIINGAISSPTIISESSKDPKYNIGVPGQLTFEFNDGFAHTETSGYAKLLNNQGRITITEFSSYVINQIKYIKITLGGHSFKNEEFTEFDFWKGEKRRYKIWETSRLSINTVTIIINGKEVYKKGAMNTELTSENEFWLDNQLQDNLVTKQIIAEKCDPVVE
ncbi:MAG: hypothetical protein R3B45_04030 [Bdellovibrionota bacterium]